MKKKTMRIGIAGKNATFTGKYHVNWGSTGNAYNRNSKGFKTRKQALSFKKKLVRKFKPKFKVDYMYLSG